MLSNIQKLPFVGIEDIDKLPQKAGLYFVIKEGEVLYIGKANNLSNRWCGHHRYIQIVEDYPQAKIYFNINLSYQSSFIKSFDGLFQTEKKYIRHFKPLLNGTKIKRKTSVGEYNDNPDVLTMKEMEDYLSLSRRTIIRLVKEKGLPGEKTNNQWKFKREDFERWWTYND